MYTKGIQYDNKTYNLKDEIRLKRTKMVTTKIPEVLKVNNWKEGDKVKVKIGDQGTIIIEKVDD